MTTKEPTTQDRLITVKKWNDYHDYPTVGGLRSLIFHASTNGFDKVIRRINGRVLIKESAFFQWVESINGHGGQK